MKTLRVTLADIVGPTGSPNSTATVTARYVDPSGRGRDVHLTDGTIVVPVRRTVTPGTVPQHFDFDVYANDVAPVREVDYGHLVEVSWTVVAPTGAKTSGVRRVAVTDDMPSVVQLGLLSTPTPVPPYTGGYVLPGELDALDARVVVLEDAPGGGGGGGTGPAGADGDSAYEVAVANGFVGSEAAWLASLVGATGPQGPAGATGPTGPAGADGDDGADGAQGPQGIQGVPGADGADGADGDSAYEVAVANGFVGSEAAWLASLVGPAGAAGADGAPGTPGADGADGATGPTGAQGPQGDPGADGADGADLTHATAQTINAQTGTSYTLVAGDAGKVVTLSNAAAITLNAPGSVFTAGQRIDVVVIGAGMATVVGTSGATANGTPSLVSRAQWSAFTILWTSATACVVIGDLA